MTASETSSETAERELSGDEDLLVEKDVKQKPTKIPKTSIWDTTDEESVQSQVISLTWCLCCTTCSHFPILFSFISC